ncbi:hypothetical protein [Trujillonella humicola]|uniref:hypothetical protein n=1 Tax=Trujillonella humicola TaxID=3383699 RepID=UPI003905D43F
MTGPLSPEDEQAVLHALRALLETERAIEEHGHDPSVSAADIQAAARRLGARTRRRPTRPVVPEPLTDDEFDFEVEWLLLVENQQIAYRGTGTPEDDRGEPIRTVLQTEDPRTGTSLVVSEAGNGRWTVRVLRAAPGRYAVELSWTGRAAEAVGEVEVVSQRPAAVTVDGQAEPPVHVRIRPVPPA